VREGVGQKKMGGMHDRQGGIQVDRDGSDKASDVWPARESRQNIEVVEKRGYGEPSIKEPLGDWVDAATGLREGDQARARDVAADGVKELDGEVVREH
jgi:hypothetical protein